MQHDVFLWWMIFCALAAMGAAWGRLCLRGASRYRRLLAAGCSPDGNTLLRALFAAPHPDSDAIIGSDESAWPRSARLLASLVPALALVITWTAHGAGMHLALMGVFVAVLSLLAAIDLRTGLLPDALTLPLLWSGLALAWAGAGPGPGLHDSLSGAMLGYLIPASLRVAWLRFRRVEGMGRGDIKLLAALGAWTGPAGVLSILLLASLAGVVFAICHQRRIAPCGSYAFGPFLVLGALAVSLPIGIA